MKKQFNIKVIVFFALIVFGVSGCATTSLEPTDTPIQTPSATLPPTLTVTPIPSPTSTPVPVVLQESIQRSTFTELEVFNKGQIQISPLPYLAKSVPLSKFSPDGTQFAAVSNRGLYIYDVNSWQELVFLPIPFGLNITSLNFSVDGSLFAAGDSSGMITFLNTQTWEVKNSFQVHDGAVTSLDIAPDNMNFVVIGDFKNISVWNMSDGSLIKSQVRSKNAGPAYYSLDGKWLYISEATPNRDLIVWSSDELTLINRLPRLGQVPPYQAISPYANIIASYGFQKVTLYDFDKQETTDIALDVEWYYQPSHFIFLDEKTLMVKFEYLETYYLIDLESYAVTEQSFEALSQKKFKNPEFLNFLMDEEIKAVGFSWLGNISHITPDGTALILSGYEYQGELTGVFDLSQKKIKSVDTQGIQWGNTVFLSDGTLANLDWPNRNSSNSNKGEITVTILVPEASFQVMSINKQPYDVQDFIETAAISPNGRILAAGTPDGSLYLWDLKTKELIATIASHHSKVGFGAYSRMFFDKDSSQIVTSGRDGKIKILRIEDLSEVFVTNGEYPVLSPDSSSLAFIKLDQSIQLVSLIEEGPARIFKGNGNPTAITFSHDGSVLFAGTLVFSENPWENGVASIQAWSVADEALLLNIPQYDYVSSLIVSPDGTHLYIHSRDGEISVWGHETE